MPHLVLLPGLDGTGELFDEFVAVTPSHFSTAIESYPSDRVVRVVHGRPPRAAKPNPRAPTAQAEGR